LTVNSALKSGQNVLFEGAQGTYLDIDHGTYPFVTSSNTISGGACTGAGVSPKYIDSIWGVMKVYTTRVGEGPFPTELTDEIGEKLGDIGGEFGATTGRARRCGWFDAVASNYSCLINGVDYLALTKLDVLDSFDELCICTAYEIDGEVVSDMPTDSELLTKVKPVYEVMPGWNSKTTDISKYEDLPIEAKNYINRLAELVDAKIGIVSVGPNRAQTFEVNL
jgi:adenylosuccinate synthase